MVFITCIISVLVLSLLTAIVYFVAFKKREMIKEKVTKSLKNYFWRGHINSFKLFFTKQQHGIKNQVSAKMSNPSIKSGNLAGALIMEAYIQFQMVLQFAYLYKKDPEQLDSEESKAYCGNLYSDIALKTKNAKYYIIPFFQKRFIFFMICAFFKHLSGI